MPSLKVVDKKMLLIVRGAPLKQFILINICEKKLIGLIKSYPDSNNPVLMVRHSKLHSYSQAGNLLGKVFKCSASTSVR